MRNVFGIVMSVLMLFLSCKQEEKDPFLLIEKGKYTEAESCIEWLLEGDKARDLSVPQKEKLEKLSMQIEAVRSDYIMDYDEMFSKVKSEIPDLTAKDIEKWEEDNSLEYYLIDGKKKYFYNCVFDLLQVNKEAAIRAGREEGGGADRTVYPMETIKAVQQEGQFSRQIHVGFSFFQNLEAIPFGKKLRAWIPYVRENALQSDISVTDKTIADVQFPEKSYPVAMLYFEHEVKEGYDSKVRWDELFGNPPYPWMHSIDKPDFVTDSTILFQFVYSYTSRALYQHIRPETVSPYDKDAPDYLKYTEETIDHLFTPFLRELSESITQGETSDYLKAKRIYEWICNNVIWTTPKVVIGDLAEYTARYRRGDCYAKSQLFISLCRMNGIPARDQGGWVVRPEGGHAQHSWAQMYFEPYGWLPVDVTFGHNLIDHEDQRLKYFYFGNCTPYHLIIYDDDSPVYPPKQYACINGGGSQLGVFQWEGGDLEPFIKIDSQVTDF